MRLIPGTPCQSSLLGNRKINQDRCTFLRENNSLLMGLADGMGGHPRGEIAAQMLIDTCEHYFSRTPQPILNPNSFLTRLLHKAHESIVAYGYEQEPAIDPRTTAVALLIHNNTAHWAHAGDSRLYLLRHKRIQAKTVDHSYVERLKQQGVISASEQKAHPQRNFVTRCLGGNISAPDISLGRHQLELDDILLMCSDGLWGSVSETQLIDAFFGGLPLQEAVDRLTQTASKKAAPSSDNVTLSAVRIEADPQQQQQQQQTVQATIQPQDESSNLAQAIADLQSAITNFEQTNLEDKE